MEEGDYIINIPDYYKSGMVVPAKLGPYNISTTKSFEYIIQVIQKE